MNKIFYGNCLDVLKKLKAQSVNMCVTSPPYFNLRDYDHDDQIGLEKTPQQYVEQLVKVFMSIHRVLKDDGTLWINIGDSYARQGGAAKKSRHWDGRDKDVNMCNAIQAKDIGLAPKNLIGVPWRLAFALQDAGWILRQDLIWHKPNPMPESVQDRFTKSHEYLFLFAKSEQYYFDVEAVREKAISNSTGTAAGFKRTNSKREHAIFGQQNGTHRPDRKETPVSEFRNKRSVWTVATKPYKGAHTAVFPTALIEPCIRAGSRENDVVLDPFMGSGTTAAVAICNNRQFVGIELNPDYKPLIDKRIREAKAFAKAINQPKYF